MQLRLAQVVLVEALPRSLAGVTQTIRLAGGGADFAYRYGGQDWLAGVVSVPSSISEIAWDENGWTGGALPQALEIVYSSTDAVRLKLLAGLVWSQATVVISVGPDGGGVGDFQLILAGKVREALFAAGRLTLRIADATEDLTRPLLVDRYAGTGGAEGSIEMRGRIKRRVWGQFFNMACDLLDPVQNIWCWADPAAGSTSVSAVKDAGLAGTLGPVIAWQGSLAATLTALIAAAIVPGGAVLAPSINCLKWWTNAVSSPLTVDGVGTGGVQTTAQLAQAVVTARSDLSFAGATIASHGVARPGSAGLVVEDEETIAAALDRLLSGMSSWWRADPTGLVLGVHDWTAAPVMTLRAVRSERQGTSAPHWQRRVGFAKNHRVHGAGEIAGALLVDQTARDAAAAAQATANNARTTVLDQLQRNPSFEIWDGYRCFGWGDSDGNAGFFNGTAITKSITAQAKRGGTAARCQGWAEAWGEFFNVTGGEKLFFEAGFETIIDATTGVNSGAARWDFGIVFSDNADGSGNPSYNYFLSGTISAAQGYQQRTSNFVVPPTNRFACLIFLFEYQVTGSDAVGLVDYYSVGRMQAGADVTAEHKSSGVIAGGRIDVAATVQAADGAVRALGYGNNIVELYDGQSYTFPIQWSGGIIPAILAVLGEADSSGDAIEARAVNISPSGFTAHVKKVIGQWTLTDVTDAAPTTHTGPIVWQIKKSVMAEAYNDQYAFTFTVVIHNLFITSDIPGYWDAGVVVIGLHINDGSGWTLRGTHMVIGGTGATTTRTATATITCDGLGVDDDFGISIQSDTYGAAIQTFHNVKYKTGGATPTLTPSDRPTKFLILGGAN